MCEEEKNVSSDLIFSFHSLFYLFRLKNGSTWLD